MEYSSVSIIALVVLFITNYDLLFKGKSADKIPARKQFCFFLISVALFYIADMLWGLFETYDIHGADYFITVSFFIWMSISVFLWTLYVVAYLGHKKVLSNLFIVGGAILMLLGITLIVVNFFQPIMFKFNDEGHYEALPFRTVYFIVQAVVFFVTFIYATITALLQRKNIKVLVKHLAIALFGLEMGAMIVVQIFVPQAPIYSFGYLLGLLIINTFVVVEQKKEYRAALAEGLYRERKAKEELGSAKQLAYTDPLTGVKNKHAYVELEENIDRQIASGETLYFALVVFDLNDLKFVNDRVGHDAGDDYIVKSSKLIKKYFKESELYRYGGDEFVLYITGDEFKERHELLNLFNKAIDKSFENGNPIIATGISDYRPGKDNTFRAVFSRADERMYIRKKQLKAFGQVNINKLNSSDGDSIADAFTKDELLKVRDESMKRINPRLALYKVFYQNEDYSLMDYLSRSSADEVGEINFIDDTFKQLYHVDGKYFVPLIGTSFSDLYQFTLDHIVHPDDRDSYVKFMNPNGLLERLRNNEIPNFDVEQFRYKLQDGDYRYVEQCVITGEENGIQNGCARLYVFDIHNYKARQNGFISNDKDILSKGRDSITNLLLEKEFFTKGQALIDDKPDLQWCLISVDITHFRFFDEWFGRESGDLLLARFGAALAESKKETGGLNGYFGKDDFAILMPYNEDMINKLYDDLRAVVMSFGSSAGFTPTFGVAIIEKGLSLMDAFDRATIAAAKAKSDATNRISYYNPEMQFLAQNESRVLSEYMEAFKNDEITFYLQPQCRISSGKIVGVEALARWVKKDGTVISPGIFVPVLEKYGFIPDLDMYIWEKVCKELRSWIDAGHLPVPVSLNVARADLFSIDVAETIMQLADKYQLPHKMLKIEITESSYGEATELVEKLVNKLRSNGFMILMDDFGSGYSSLNMLSSLTIDAIKLDMNFLKFEGKDYEKAVHVLESVVNMAKVMALPIIVEGVEKKEHADFLESLGCRYIQGYYFYKPMPIEEAKKLLLNEDNIDQRGFVVKLNEQMRIREFMDKNIFSDSMLNNILGPVAFYSWDGKKTDIVRYNEQFYQAVHVQTFSERLNHIEQFIHKNDAEKMHNAFKKAMEDKLTGHSEILRFYTPDGTILSFNIHFYYLGRKEGGERFFGAAQNVTSLTDLLEEKKLIANYSKEGLTFVRKVDNEMFYSVASSGIADLLDITPEQLEMELNNGDFAKKRVVNRRKYDSFRKAFAEFSEQNRNFEATLEVYDAHHRPIVLNITFTCVSEMANNIQYILRTKVY